MNSLPAHPRRLMDRFGSRRTGFIPMQSLMYRTRFFEFSVVTSIPILLNTLTIAVLSAHISRPTVTFCHPPYLKKASVTRSIPVSMFFRISIGRTGCEHATTVVGNPDLSYLTVDTPRSFASHIPHCSCRGCSVKCVTFPWSSIFCL